MPISIYALATTDVQADSIITALGSIGFLVDDLSVLLPADDPLRLFAHEPPRQEPAPPASAGASQPVIGGAVGWISGISRLAIPGLDPVIAAGPIKALLNGTVLGAVDGGLAGALTGLGLPSAEADRYVGRIRAGRILIAASSDKGAWIAKAMQVLRDAGAEDIGSSGEEASAHASATDGVPPPAEGEQPLARDAPAPRAEAPLQERSPPVGSGAVAIPPPGPGGGGPGAPPPGEQSARQRR